ncbi:uncharacterized protein LOC112506176 [Cynara cardunculus var. scolymus]|uniref:uncharacterized protein LOC112506176 n=1 Tax=Cynara cardunculus var. scolymus TaxID=59895 RepID=UPI000D630F5C|nr:uncharacterized protein LOC112506176 [Cynara cardunculus var. scolymus]
MVMFFGIGTRKGTINEESINTQHRHRTPGRVWERLPSTVTTSFTPLHHCLYFLGSSVIDASIHIISSSQGTLSSLHSRARVGGLHHISTSFLYCKTVFHHFLNELSLLQERIISMDLTYSFTDLKQIYPSLFVLSLNFSTFGSSLYQAVMNKSHVKKQTTIELQGPLQKCYQEIYV